MLHIYKYIAYILPAVYTSLTLHQMVKDARFGKRNLTKNMLGRHAKDVKMSTREN